jgi:hypothetical protein
VRAGEGRRCVACGPNGARENGSGAATQVAQAQPCPLWRGAGPGCGATSPVQRGLHDRARANGWLAKPLRWWLRSRRVGQSRDGDAGRVPSGEVWRRPSRKRPRARDTRAPPAHRPYPLRQRRHARVSARHSPPPLTARLPGAWCLLFITHFCINSTRASCEVHRLERAECKW